MDESNWIIPIVIAIIAATPGILALFRQMRQDTQKAEIEEGQANTQSRLDLDLASWIRAGETMQRQEKKITGLEECIEDLEIRLEDSDIRIRKLEHDIIKYGLLLEGRDKTILELERKLKEAWKENDALKKKLGEQ